jgi:hypothetical protein
MRNYTNLSGVSFIKDLEDKVKDLKAGQPLTMKREKDNSYDKYAIQILAANDVFLGYIKADVARVLAPRLDDGENLYCYLSAITGGGEYNIGINILITDEPLKRKRKVLFENTPEFDNCIKGLKDGKTMGDIEEYYIVTDAVKSLLVLGHQTEEKVS